MTRVTTRCFYVRYSLMRTLAFVEKGVHNIVLITGVNEDGFIKVVI